MLSPLALPVQLDKALRAEEIHAVLAQYGGVVVLALEAHQTIDHALQVITQVRPRGVEGMHIKEALVRVEETALDALARRHAVLVGRADELLHVGGDVRAPLPRGVRAVEAVLAEVVLALLALHHGRSVLALLAHDDARRFSDDVDLVLLLADLTEELHRILQVRKKRVQVEFLFHVRLQRLLDASEQEELLGTIHTDELRKALHCVWRSRRQALRRAPHHLCNDCVQLLLRPLHVDADVAALELLLVAPRLEVELFISVDEGVRLLHHFCLFVVVHGLAVRVRQLLPIRRHRRAGGLLRDPQQLRLVDDIHAD
mmetsp:Transcript_130663/g.378000  ORF Transcript_130663/g.378000 Transcript_130663/m.378000 type:complete len:314 (+) Transcript_130663:342-1283(+)